MNFYENLFDTYNFCDKTEIIDSFKVSTEEDFNELTQLKQVEYYENQSDKLLFKNRSEIVLFLLTKNYYKSKLFDKHWNEALQMKKPILVLSLEPDLKWEFKDFEVFDIADYVNRSLKFDYLYLFTFNFHLKNGFDAMYFKFIKKVKMLLGITDEERVSRKEIIRPENLILIF
jgi:hypothetical protein